VRRHAYFQVNLAHLLGLVMLLGAIGVVDLRALGVGRRLPMRDLAQTLVPIGVAGLALMLVSGALLFAADAGTLVASSVFQAKAALIALGIANALAFERWFGGLPSGALPPAARAMAGLSLATWLGAATLGRLIGYV
jgi:hypothetical protein